MLIRFHLPLLRRINNIMGLMDRGCLSPHPGGVLLRVRVSPNAARTAPEGLRAGAGGEPRLALRLKAPPVEGKANKAAVRWAAAAFGIRPAAVTLLRGEKSREKDLLLAGLTLEEAGAALDKLLIPTDPKGGRCDGGKEKPG